MELLVREVLHTKSAVSEEVEDMFEVGAVSVDQNPTCVDQNL